MKKLIATIITLFVSISLFAFSITDLEGKWYLACKTPIGVKKGYLECKAFDETSFTGILNIFGKDNEIQNGQFKYDEFSFSGNIQFWGKIPYIANGEVVDSGFVKCVIDSEKGVFVAIAYREEEKLKDAKNILKQMEMDINK